MCFSPLSRYASTLEGCEPLKLAPIFVFKFQEELQDGMQS